MPVTVLSLIIERPWCKYLCPYGALLGLFNKIRIFKIRRNPDSCIHCKKCDKVCPMNIKVSGKTTISDLQCISCHQCTSDVACPVQDTVTISAGKKDARGKIKPQTVIFAVLAIFLAGILASMAAGLWNTTADKTPSNLSKPGLEGQYDPADIKGSYTFGEISSLYNVPLETMAAAFGVSEGNASAFKCKDLESIYADSEFEIGTGSVKMFTAYYLGLPYTPTEDTYLPQKAALLLEENGKMTQEQSDYLAAHTVAAE